MPEQVARAWDSGLIHLCMLGPAAMPARETYMGAYVRHQGPSPENIRACFAQWLLSRSPTSTTGSVVKEATYHVSTIPAVLILWVLDLWK